MKKLIVLLLALLLNIPNGMAKVSDFDRYFVVDMDMEIPNLKEYIKKFSSLKDVYDKGYNSRYRMGRKFNQEFGRTIRLYGLSEGRIKNDYEDELLEILSWLPKEAYQYIGPMLHQVPGMSEKILNMPGIKETKNKFPEDVAEKFKGVENIEFLSPGLYFLLMPEIWGEKKPEDLDRPRTVRVKKPRISTELPDFLKEKIREPQKDDEKEPAPASAVKEKSSNSGKGGRQAQAHELSLRTLYPTLTSPLTSKDVGAFVATLDDVVEFGLKDQMRNHSKLILGEALLNMWELEQGTALKQNNLKDLVNPCQRLVLKTRFAGIYDEFAAVVIKQGFTPEEWAYTCDKTFKAFRVTEANQAVAYAVRFHRRGYYDQYIKQLPEKWQDEMYAVEAAIIKMYNVFKEDVNTVRPYQKEIGEKMLKNRGMLLTTPIFY